jgi:uncharacterized protein (DUF302 family)
MVSLLALSSAQAAAASLTASKEADMQTALVDLTIALENHGYQLVKVQPMDKALVKRGFDDPGVRLAFVGKASQVQQALDTDPALLNVLPLRLTMVRENGRVHLHSDDLDEWRKRSPAGEGVVQAWQGELADILADFEAQ